MPSTTTTSTTSFVSRNQFNSLSNHEEKKQHPSATATAARSQRQQQRVLSEVITSLIKSRTKALFDHSSRKAVGNSEAAHFMQFAKGISSEDGLQLSLLSRLLKVYGFFPGLKVAHIDSALRAHHTTLSALMGQATA
jgi:hypothetical protein